MDEIAGIRAMFEHLQSAVRARDYEAVRPLIAADALMFGSYAQRMTGFEEMRDLQFRHVWPRIGDFTIDFDSMRVEVRGALAWVAFLFHTSAKDDAGQTFRRQGRMTFVLEHMEGGWRIVHSHDSLSPSGTLRG